MHTSIVEKLAAFFTAFPTQSFQKGEVLIQADRQPTGIFYIEEGIVRRYWITEKGEEITLNLYKPHAFLPMSWAIGDVQNIHFYEAMTPVKTRKAPKQPVLAFLKNEPDVLLDLLHRVYVGLEGLWMHIESLTTGNATIKLIASLVILGKRFGKKSTVDTVVQLKMTESDIANYAGMSRETASRELQKLKKQGLVDFAKGEITIHDIFALEQLLAG